MRKTVRGIRFLLYLPVQFFPKILPPGPFVLRVARFIVWVDSPLRRYMLRGFK